MHPIYLLVEMHVLGLFTRLSIFAGFVNIGRKESFRASSCTLSVLHTYYWIVYLTFVRATAWLRPSLNLGKDIHSADMI